VVLVAGGAAGYWLYGDRFPSVVSRLASGAAEKVTDVASRSSERLDSEEGARVVAENEARRLSVREARDSAVGWITLKSATRDAATPSRPGAANPLAPLAKRTGPAYVSLSPVQLAGVLAPLVRQLPPSARQVQLAIKRDQLLLRADIALREVTGAGALGSVIGGALDGRDTLFMAGTFEPVRPGLAQYRVRELRIKGIDVPSRVIPSLVSTLRRRAPRTGTTATADDYAQLAPDALPVPLPRTVADIRVVNGKVTLYKAAQ